MFLAFIPLAILVAVIIGLVALFRSFPRAVKPVGDLEGRAATPVTMRRLFAYVLAFVGLISVLYAVAGLLTIAAATVLLHSSSLLSVDDLRSRASFYLAALIVGLPLWLASWRFAQRRGITAPEEYDAPERRLFFATVFAVTSVMVLLAGQAFLQYCLSVPGAVLGGTSAVDGIDAAARFLVYGLSWLVFARLPLGPGEVANSWWQDRARDAHSWHDIAVFIIAGVALAILANGLIQALREVIGATLDLAQSVVIAPGVAYEWTIWGSIAASLVIGGLGWMAIWRYDMARGGRRQWRVLYLYLVLLIAVPATLGTGIDGLYEVLRRAFGYQSTTPDWTFLQDTVPLILVGGVAWIYHWSAVQHQADLSGASVAGTERRDAGILWPRRPGLALLSLAGLVTALPAFISLLWLALDVVVDTSVSLSGPDWWRDRLSLSIAAGLVGLSVWLATWSELQRAAVNAPAEERPAQARRLLVGVVVVGAALCGIGFTIAVLWQVLEVLLGVPRAASTLSIVLKDLSTVVLMLILVAYYGVILRGDLRVTAGQATPLRLTALIAPGAEEMLASLRHHGYRVEVGGYLAPDASYVPSEQAVAEALLAALSADAMRRDSSVLVVVYPDSIGVLPYTKAAPRVLSPVPAVMAP